MFRLDEEESIDDIDTIDPDCAEVAYKKTLEVRQQSAEILNEYISKTWAELMVKKNLAIESGSFETFIYLKGESLYKTANQELYDRARQKGYSATLMEGSTHYSGRIVISWESPLRSPLRRSFRSPVNSPRGSYTPCGRRSYTPRGNSYPQLIPKRNIRKYSS